jgi:hypothetical protein
MNEAPEERTRRREQGLQEIRGIWAPPKLHAQAKRLVKSAVQACAGARAKCVGILIEEADGYPVIDLSPSLMNADEKIAYLESLASHITASIAQLEHDSR